MFQNVDFDAVGFSSVNSNKEPSLKRDHKESFSQTENESLEEGIQTTSVKNSEIQTEEVVNDLDTSGACNIDDLAAFLKKISPGVLEELDKSEKSKAFTFFRDAQEQEFSVDMKAVYSIQSAELPNIPQIDVSCLSWSCTGNVINFGYATPQHSDWCTHNSSVHFYNIKMSDFNEKNPKYSIPTSSCVTALSNHPFEPAIVAVGTTDGDVYIWDLKKVDNDANICNINTHKDRITKLSWENINSQLYLVASSLDAFLSLFKVVPSMGTVTVSDRFVMTSEEVTGILPGISTFGFSLQPGIFVVALESGELLHCSTFSAPIIPMTTLKNPVLKTLQKKMALVNDLKFSPYLEHLFVTCCVDKMFYVYSLKESTYLHKINLDFFALGVAWSPNQGKVFFVWGESDKVYVYNSDTGKVISELQSDCGACKCIKSVAICSKNSKMAVSVENGKVLIWEMPLFFKM